MLTFSSYHTGLSRNGIAVTAVSGLTALYFLYLIWPSTRHSRSKESRAGLQRSNAVRRPASIARSPAPADSNQPTAPANDHALRALAPPDDNVTEHSPVRDDDALQVQQNAHPATNPPQLMHQLVFNISEARTITEGRYHRGVSCDHCNRYIHGIRYMCLHCPDYNLCQTCETTHAHGEVHIPTHVFAKIHAPVSFHSRRPEEPWYPGTPELPRSLDPDSSALNCAQKYALKVAETTLETTRLQILYWRFTFAANTRVNSDACPLKEYTAIPWTINRPAFYMSFLPRHASDLTNGQNIIFDRIFTIFNQHGDGLISFEEFTAGCAFLNAEGLGMSWRRVFKALDLYEDRHVSRSNFISFFEGLFDLDAQLINSGKDRGRLIEAEEIDAAETIRSKKSLAAYFTDETPRHPTERDARHLIGKTLNTSSGDMTPHPIAPTSEDAADPDEPVVDAREWPISWSLNTPQRGTKAQSTIKILMRQALDHLLDPFFPEGDTKLSWDAQGSPGNYSPSSFQRRMEENPAEAAQLVGWVEEALGWCIL